MIIGKLAAVRAYSLPRNLASSIFLDVDFEVVIKSLLSEEISFASYGHLVDEDRLLANTFVQVNFPMLGDKVIMLFMILLDMLMVYWYRWRMFFHTLVLYV